MALSGREAVRRVVEEQCLAAAVGGTRVGVESEHFVIAVGHDGRPRGRVALDELQRVLDAQPDLRREAADARRLTGWVDAAGTRVLPEPGAQLEIATPAAATPASALALLEQRVRALADACDARGVTLASAGLDVWHDAECVPQQLDLPRYPAMAAYLRSRTPHGHTMMCHTASLQVNLDADAGAERWRTALLVAPLAVAAFACSPVPGAVSGRALVWRGLDPTRTGIPARFVAGEDDPGAVTVDLALAADVLLVRRGGRVEPGRPGWTFREWLDDGHPSWGPPTAEDLAYHLSTLFPEVRLRGWLEVRGVDALPARWRAVPVVLYAGLLYDRRAMDAAAAVMERHRARLPELLWRAATVGVADPELCAMAVEVWTAAAAGARRLPAGACDPADLSRAEAYLDRYTLRGRAPSDELRERFAAGPAASLAWASEPVASLTAC